MKNFLQIVRYAVVGLVLGLGACGDSGKDNDPDPQPIDNTVFTNPVLTAGPDPWIIKHTDNNYYLTHTTGNSLKLYRTKDPSQIGNAFSSNVWTAPATGMNSRNIWAPELHFVNNKWYFYYAADDGNNANHRMWVLENSNANPFAGTWVDKGKLALPDDKWAIDGSIFEHNGQLYFTWSGWEGNTDGQQNLYIVKMSDPTTPDGPRIKISSPDLSWERNGGPAYVNEGPQFLAKDNKVFIIYSASGCWTDDYALGMLSADAEADLSDPESWTKSDQPVFQKSPNAKAFGPGHNSFFKSPDGTEDWIIYHANPVSGQGCGNNRSIRMQPFTWNENGTPNFGVPVELYKKIKKPSGEQTE